MDQAEKEPMFAEERKRKILELLEQNEKISVQELCEYFGVSSSTIRNDLREMDSEKLLERTHGGAILPSKKSFELTSTQKEVKNLDEKKAIAQIAADMIEDGDTILLDTGTTTLELARNLKNKRDITVVVNDIEIARCLEDFDGVSIILLGGIMRKKFHCAVGPIAINALSTLSVDKAFMATNGVSFKKGLSTPEINQAEVKKMMISISSEVILLCDSSKIGKDSFVKFASISEINKIVTDSNLSKYDAVEFEENKIEVIIAK